MLLFSFYEKIFVSMYVRDKKKNIFINNLYKNKSFTLFAHFMFKYKKYNEQVLKFVAFSFLSRFPDFVTE